MPRSSSIIQREISEAEKAQKLGMIEENAGQDALRGDHIERLQAEFAEAEKEEHRISLGSGPTF